MKLRFRIPVFVLLSLFVFISCEKEECEKESLANEIEGSYCYTAEKEIFDGLQENGHWNSMEHVTESGVLEIKAISNNQVKITDFDKDGKNFSFVAECRRSAEEDDFVYLDFNKYEYIPYVDENTVFGGIGCVFKTLNAGADGSAKREEFTGRINPDTKELLTEYIVKTSDLKEAVFIKKINNCKKTTTSKEEEGVE